MRVKTTLAAILVLVILVGCTSTDIPQEKTGMDAVKLVSQGEVDEGIRILEKLAEEGDDQAMVQLGLYYYEGAVVQQNYPMAMDWFLQALAHRNADAFVNLGVMHRDGSGVPENKKIAYCVFLTTYMEGLGSESTQYRANSCLRRLIQDVSNDDIKDCLSNYTVGYIFSYLESKGAMTGIPDDYKPSKERPALRDLDWWLDGELETLYGQPAVEAEAVMDERGRQRRQERVVLKRTLVFEIRMPNSGQPQFRTFELITDGGLSSGTFAPDKIQERDGYRVYAGDELIFNDVLRYITVENSNGATFIFKIDHPVKPVLCDWNEWRMPDYALRDRFNKITLMKGGTPAGSMDPLPSPSPEIRFKVVK